MSRLLFASFLASAAALVACYQPPTPECAFSCVPGIAETCPGGYSCRGDGMCKREGVADDFACRDTPDAAIDGPVIDAPIDAAAIDAAIDAATDAATIDAAIDAAVDAPIDAAVDAPIDAFAGLRITTAGPVDFGSTTMGTPVTRTIMVTNDGSATTTAITVTVTTTGGGGDYTRVTGGTDTCSTATLAMSATCMFNVSFDPSTTGARTGMAEVSASTGGMSSVNLTGVGQ
jgi:hypothetical protein